jgi:hypothetical protein
MTQCLRLRPNDSEAQAVQKAWKASAVRRQAGALEAGADEEPGPELILWSASSAALTPSPFARRPL